MTPLVQQCASDAGTLSSPLRHVWVYLTFNWHAEVPKAIVSNQYTSMTLENYDIAHLVSTYIIRLPIVEVESI